ncbi:MAG TPA: tryptophan--tRNA ligase [Lentisphaeria bacterium]|nr:MAG: tryptophan--tRNA ligase [Lentisphaerae bacterium GWF2_49_21]HBC86621.1 tryptophan--tRNA ligase [Lentisphaeria bacterium]
MRILSGIQPSGTIHIGNYFGMMKPAMELSKKGEAFLFIADYHALTVLPEPEKLRERVRDVAVDFIACGLTEETLFFKQSDILSIPEFTWILSCVTPMGLLERCHSYKDKLAHGFSPNHGLFAYPVLMAADILIYKSNIVPVGKDQKQHVEVARDIAQRFNNKYGNILVMPESTIRDDVAIVPGTDGQKMSKTYGNTIELFGNEKEIRKKIMGIVTDSKPLEAPKEPEKCPVFALYKLFASESQAAAMAENYRKGGYGYGHAKKELFDVFWEYFRPFRTRREELLKDMGYVDSFLKKGAQKAGEVAGKTLKEVRESVGL